MRPSTCLAFLLAIPGCAPVTSQMEPVPGTEQPPPQEKPVSAPATIVPPPAPVVTTPTEPSGYDLANLDRAANPCDNFYQFACGGWLKRTEIPADRARWGSFSIIDERNLAVERSLLEADAAGKGNVADAYRDKLGDYWSACMDEPKIEKAALADLKAVLSQVGKVKNIAELSHEVARLQLASPGPVLFGVGSTQDFKDATQVIAILDQGGIALPDRDYYLKDEGKFKEIREEYVRHVARMFALAGEPKPKAEAAAQTVLRIEHALAEGALSRVDRRDPNKVYHRINLKGIEEKAPQFPWVAYWKELGHPDVNQINVAVPEFFTRLNELLVKEKMADWHTYLRWTILHGFADTLPKPLVDENFRFFGQVLSGTKELPPRWKRCVQASDRALGFALAQSFVRETFGAEGKERTLAMVRTVEHAMGADLDQLAWMDDATRRQALEKLHAIANKIGYPDTWRSYDALQVGRASYLKNLMAAATFESHRELAKIGKPLDRTEWFMTPPTVNAYYNPSMNEMVFPAGILQSPFFDRAARPSVNYGAIGMVMGHELTHGFDDQGRQFDAIGNLRDWWSPRVGEEFRRRAECVVKQFDGYVAVDDLHLNGKLTLGENIADLGGLKLAHHAVMTALGDRAVVHPVPGEFTDEQLFFLGAAQAWCAKTRPENARMRVTTDPHAPPEYRINGPFSNLPDFAHAFQCKAGDKMVRQDACGVW